MRVALGKVPGVASVDVTLKRGVAAIGLVDGNAVTLAQLRQVVKEAGYASRDAVVTVRGTIGSRDGATVLAVTGTAEIFRLEASPDAPGVLTASLSGVNVEVTGTVIETDTAAKTPAVLQATKITRR